MVSAGCLRNTGREEGLYTALCFAPVCESYFFRYLLYCPIILAIHIYCRLLDREFKVHICESPSEWIGHKRPGNGLQSR